MPVVIYRLLDIRFGFALLSVLNNRHRSKSRVVLLRLAISTPLGNMSGVVFHRRLGAEPDLREEPHRRERRYRKHLEERKDTLSKESGLLAVLMPSYL